MAQKNTTPTKAQQEAMKRAGLDPREWTVKKELSSQLIIIRRGDHEVRMIDKEKNRPRRCSPVGGMEKCPCLF